MKVIKRDGRIVDYDKSKIKIAIEKANKEVTKKEKASKEEIQTIIDYIEELDKKRILVEDIQDIIEQKLMELGKYELAKKYIVYRYTRALVRKSNTTDESILGIIRNKNREVKKDVKNKISVIASMERDLIAGEVSKDLTKRILLPEKITNAWEEGVLHFHNAEYFVQPIINSSCIKIGDMLENGTVINGVNIEKPKNFHVACAITAQIIADVSSNQYGEVALDIMHLGKYLRKSKESFKEEIKEILGEKCDESIIEKFIEKRTNSELNDGIETLKYKIDTTMTVNGHKPLVKLFVHLDENDEYIAENKLIYNAVIDMENVEEISENYEGKFNQGVVSINLPQIGIISQKDEVKFWKELEERLEICKEALMCKHYALMGTAADISPIHWKYGAISRLECGEKIDKLLYGYNSSISLGYVGLHEVGKFMKGEESEKEIQEFENKLLKILNKKITKWKTETNIGFELCEILDEDVRKRFAKIDKEKFGTIEGINNLED